MLHRINLERSEFQSIETGQQPFIVEDMNKIYQCGDIIKFEECLSGYSFRQKIVLEHLTGNSFFKRIICIKEVRFEKCKDVKMIMGLAEVF